MIRDKLLQAMMVVVLGAIGVEETYSADKINATVTKDIVYAKVDGHTLALDLYMPKDVDQPQLIVWIHGGAWRAGSKNKVPITSLLDYGYAIASVDYRLSPVAKFPALVHDCKGAIRFLRANAKKYGYRASKLGISGSSAGGHLVALIGTTNGVKELEGDVGGNSDQSSDVHAIVDLYGASNFMTILSQSTEHGLSVRVPALELLLGGQPEEKKELAKLASPVFHVDKDDPPLLMIHGDADPQMPIEQSYELHEVYKKYKLLVQFEVIKGGKHGGKEFYDATRTKMAADFFKQNL